MHQPCNTLFSSRRTIVIASMRQCIRRSMCNVCQRWRWSSKPYANELAPFCATFFGYDAKFLRTFGDDGNHRTRALNPRCAKYMHSATPLMWDDITNTEDSSSCGGKEHEMRLHSSATAFTILYRQQWVECLAPRRFLTAMLSRCTTRSPWLVLISNIVQRPFDVNGKKAECVHVHLWRR